MDKKSPGIQFTFKKNDNIGSADAENDEKYLSECFVDTGDIDVLKDFADAKRIIVGRTGSGKSALLRMVASTVDHAIEIKPESLSLNFLGNSSVLRFFEDAGTHLDISYQLLWKHVIAVELLRYKYKITNETTQRSFFERLTSVFSKDRTKEQAIKYLNEWGANFWNETESRVREVTRKIESDLKASVSGTSAGMKLEAGAGEKLSEEEKSDVVQRGSRAVSQVQLAALSNVLRLLEDEVFTDNQEGCFILIDDLDTRWVEDKIKYKLIRALIETVRAFRQVSQVKILIALRLDLLQRVIAATRDSGFQSEKYEPLYLRIRWTQGQIIDVVAKRINSLIRKRYTSRPITMDELFPREIHKTRFTEFLCLRTSLRPREAILFTNECLSRATDRQQITVQVVTDAEASYSEKRVHSLQEEWSSIYPEVSDYLKILNRKSVSFPMSEFSRAALEDWASAHILRDGTSTDPVAIAAKTHYLEEKGTFFEFALVLVDALYTVGAIGVKPDATSHCYWSHHSDHRPSPGSIRPNSTIQVHPTFWRALGIRSDAQYSHRQ